MNEVSIIRFAILPSQFRFPLPSLNSRVAMRDQGAVPLITWRATIFQEHKSATNLIATQWLAR